MQALQRLLAVAETLRDSAVGVPVAVAWRSRWMCLGKEICGRREGEMWHYLVLPKSFCYYSLWKMQVIQDRV